MFKRGDKRKKPLKPAAEQNNKNNIVPEALLQVSRTRITYFKAFMKAPTLLFFLWIAIIVIPALIKAMLS